MKHLLYKTFLLFFLCLSVLFFFTPVRADENDDKLRDLQSQIAEFQAKIEDAQGKKQTLASTISYLNSKIQLTETQISKTQTEINIVTRDITALSDKIDKLDISLDSLSEILAARVEETYKRMYFKPFFVLLRNNFASNVLTHLEYLKVLQSNDKQVLFQMETTREDFNQQKNLKKQKQAELESLEKTLSSQKISLAQQKASKESLLEQTKNDEANFQSLLAKARAELEAIQSIIAGQGEESEAGDVNEGDRIATVISGASACSTDTHLHFELAKGGAHNNPASYLQPKDVAWDLCGGWYGCDDPFSFIGSWSWPLPDPITITQGYGMTAFARSGYYGGNPHTGIDMLSDNLGVKAVQKGKLFRGSIACGGGTLRYVRVEHSDSDIDTYYLHVNYY